MFIRSLETSRPSAARRGREESNSQKTVLMGAWLGLTFYDMCFTLSCFLILPLEFRNHLHVHAKIVRKYKLINNTGVMIASLILFYAI